MRLDSAPPAIYDLAGVVSLVVFLATFCATSRPARPCVRMSIYSRERGEAAEEARTANNAQSPPSRHCTTAFTKKGGIEYYIYSSFCFIEIKTLNHRKRDSTSHIKSIVREINN
jgi:hypothetical protein